MGSPFPTLFWIGPEIELARNHQLSDQDLSRALQLVIDHEQEIREMPGSATSAPEVSNISKHGFWILIDDHEHFLPFAEFPWFKHATIEATLRLERPSPQHLRWPDLDVDLSLDSIEHPERYPLTSKP